MESRFIRNEQITASSEYQGYPPENGRLNSDEYWATADKNPSDQQWIQVDFLDRISTKNDVIMMGIRIQGSGSHIFDSDCWVKSLQIQTGDTSDGFKFIYEEGSKDPKVIPHVSKKN